MDGLAYKLYYRPVCLPSYVHELFRRLLSGFMMKKKKTRYVGVLTITFLYYTFLRRSLMFLLDRVAMWQAKGYETVPWPATRSLLEITLLSASPRFS